MRSDHLDVYDSGVCVQLDDAREVYSHERVANIREAESATTAADELAAAPADIEDGE